MLTYARNGENNYQITYNDEKDFAFIGDFGEYFEWADGTQIMKTVLDIFRGNELSVHEITQFVQLILSNPKICCIIAENF